MIVPTYKSSPKGLSRDGDSPTFSPVTVPRVHSLLLHGPAWLLRSTKVQLEQTSPWCCTASRGDQHRGVGGLAEPREAGREGLPHLFPSPPSHLADLLHALLPPGQNPAGVSLGTAHPAWGQKGWWELGALPRLTPLQERPPKTATGTSAACRLPGDVSWQVPPKISLWNSGSWS